MTKVKTHYQYIIAMMLVLVMVLVVYARDLTILANEALQDESLSYLILVPFLVGILFYLKKDVLKATNALEKSKKTNKTRFVDVLVGMIVCLIAFLVYWYGSYTFYPLEYHLFSLPILLMGATLILLDFKALKVLILPLIFMFFIVPPPSDYLYAAGGALGNINTQTSFTILKTLGLPVSLTSLYGAPTLVLNTTQAGQNALFTVDLACSGVYSLIAFAIFAAFIALAAIGSPLKKILLFILGFFVFEALNIVRIVSIVFIGYSIGVDIAMILFHAVAGIILIFTGMLFVLFVSERFLGIHFSPKPPKQPDCPQCIKSSDLSSNFCSSCGKLTGKIKRNITKEFWAKLIILMLGCTVLSLSVNAPTFAVAQGPIGMMSNSNWSNATNVFPSNVMIATQNFTLRYLYGDTTYEKIAHQDASLWYAYSNPKNATAPLIYVDVGVASSISNLHNWEVCLITWQTAQGHYPLVSTVDSRDVVLLPDVPLIAQFLVFNSPYNYTQDTLYWYETATFHVGLTAEQRYVRISLIILQPNATNYQQHENQLLTLGQAIAPYWELLKSQTLVSLGIPIQQAMLVTGAVIVAITKTTEYSAEWRKRTNNRKIFDHMASRKEKLLLSTIEELSKEKKSMETSDIINAIRSKTNKNISTEKTWTLLSNFEEHGFIKKDITSKQNQPKQVWKL